MLRTGLIAASLSALATTSVLAADLPRRMAPPPVFTPVPVFTWSGFYLGGNVGYALSDDQFVRTVGNNSAATGTLIPNPANPMAPLGTDTVNNVALLRRTPSIDLDQKGFTGGGQIGYNVQLTPGTGVVIGVEADAQYMDLQRSRRYLSPDFNDPSTFQHSLDYLGTVRGRLGYAFDRVLFYGTGGFAYGQVNYGAQFFSNNVAAGNPLAYTGRYSDIQTGYTFGGGIEYALPTDSFLNFFRASAVTLKAEYLYYDLGSRNVTVDSINPAKGTTFVAAANGSYTSRFSTEGHIFRGGINFKFGGL